MRRLLPPVIMALTIGNSLASADLPSSLSRWETLAPAGATASVEDRTIDGESFRLSLRAGRLRVLTDRDGAPAGAVFEGDGQLELGPVPAERVRVTRHNVRAFLGRGAWDGEQVRVPFRRLLILGRGGAIQNLAALPPGPELRSKALLRVVEERLKTYRSIDRPPVSHSIVAAELDGEDGEIMHFLLETGRGDCLLTRDARPGGQEDLFFLEPRRRIRAPAPLAAYPLGRPRRSGRRVPFVIRESELQVEDRGLPRLEVRGTLELVPTRSGDRAVRLTLRNHQADRDVAWDKGGRRVRVVSLSDGDGTPLSFVHRNHELLVALAQPMAAGTPIRLRFVLDAEIGIQPGGDRYFLLRTLPWHPRSPDDAEAYRLQWDVTTSLPFRPLVSGEVRARGEAGGRASVSTTTRMPVRFGAVVAGTFDCVERAEEPAVRVCMYGSPNRRVASAVADYFAAAEETLAELLAPFPFRELTVVELPLLDLAQATPGMILLSRELILPNVDPISQQLGADAPKRMIHELAHTWWGQMVKYLDPGDVWLSESFAEYFAGETLARLAGPEILDALRRSWRQQAERSNEAATLYTAPDLAGPDAFVAWSDLLYGKGPLLIDAIRARVGDEGFLRSMQRLLAERWGGFLTTTDLARTLEEETGTSIQDLLERCFYGDELP